MQHYILQWDGHFHISACMLSPGAGPLSSRDEAARLNRLLAPVQPITGEELRQLVLDKWGVSYDVRLQKRGSRIYLHVRSGASCGDMTVHSLWGACWAAAAAHLSMDVQAHLRHPLLSRVPAGHVAVP